AWPTASGSLKSRSLSSRQANTPSRAEARPSTGYGRGHVPLALACSDTRRQAASHVRGASGVVGGRAPRLTRLRRRRRATAAVTRTRTTRSTGRMTTAAPVLLEMARALARPAWRASALARSGPLRRRPDVPIALPEPTPWERGWGLDRDRPD